MVKVTWKVYGRLYKERTFDCPVAARKFFYGYIVKAKHITSGTLDAI